MRSEDEHDRVRPPVRVGQVDEPASDNQVDRLVRQLTDREKDLVESQGRLRAAEAARGRAVQEAFDLRRRLEFAESKASKKIEDLGHDLEQAQSAWQASERDREAMEQLLAAKEVEWRRESRQLQESLSGLSIEIKNHHDAAREISRQLQQAQVQLLHQGGGLNELGGRVCDDAGESVAQRSNSATIAELREDKQRLERQVEELSKGAELGLSVGQMEHALRESRLEQSLMTRQLAEAEARGREMDSLRGRIVELEAALERSSQVEKEQELLRTRSSSSSRWLGGGLPTQVESEVGQAAYVGRGVGVALDGLLQSSEARAVVVADEMGFTVDTAGEEGA